MKDVNLRKQILGIVGIVVVLALSNVALAIPYQYGDVFAAIGDGNVQHYDKNGNLLETLNTGLGGQTTGMAFDSNSNLYVTNFDKQSVAKFDNTGKLKGTFGGVYVGFPESILFDTSRNAYVGTVEHVIGISEQLIKFNAGGTMLADFTVAAEGRGADWIDLATDQCTLYYTSEGFHIKRFDVCTNTQLSDFARLDHRRTFALRLLPGGGVLVANGADIHRLDGSGNIVQTYNVPSENTVGCTYCWFAINIDPDGKSFWSGNTLSGHFFKFDIASGNVLMDVNTGVHDHLGGLAVFGEQTRALGGISGQKFNDLNGNGVKDLGEHGLPGWTIVLTKPDGTTVTQTTNVNGDYNFGSLSTGTYTVSEQLQSGWKQTAPIGGIYTIAITPADYKTGKDFGNTNIGSISGTKFEDVNANGHFDSGEPVLSDWTIVLTKPGGTKTTQITDVNGNYKFDNLVAGEYTVGEILRNGYIQTAPAVSEIGSAIYTVDLNPGENVQGKVFGNYKLGEVHGMKWEDLNANGEKDPGEKGIAGWEITIKGTDTITGKAVNLITTTDTYGSYRFMDLTAGTYIINEKAKCNEDVHAESWICWVQIWPTIGSYTISMTSGTVITELDFGNFKKGKITGGGYISENGKKATFALGAQYPDHTSTAQGNVEYQDQVNNMKIRSIKINTVATTIDKKKGVITGLAMVNGAGSYYFEAYVEDNGEPGTGMDVFKISLPRYPYSNGATLRGGNIQIHS